MYHGTDAELQPGAHIKSANELGIKPANSGSMVGDPDATYMTPSLKSASRWGQNVYPVRALTEHTEDHDAVTPGDRMSYGHLEILPHTPETLAATQANHAKRQAADASMATHLGQVCESCGKTKGQHPTPLWNRHLMAGA